MEDQCFYQSVVEQTSVGYSYNKVLYDTSGEPEDYEFIQVNKTYEEILGIQGENWIEKKLSELYRILTKDSIPWQSFHEKIFTEYKKGEFWQNFKYQGKHYRVKVYSPKTGYIIISLTDISKEIGETEKLQTLLDNVPIEIWYLKDPYTYLSANKAHADFLGYMREDFVDRKLREVVREEQAEICIAGNQKVFNEKKQRIVEEWMTNFAGEQRLLKITKTPKMNSQGDIQFVICSAEDITEDYFVQKQNEIQDRILHSSIDFTVELLTNDNLNEALLNGLEMLGNATKVDRVYYWKNHFDKDSKKWLTSRKFEWDVEKGVQEINDPKLQNVALENAGDFIEALAKNEPFSCHTKNIDPEEFRIESYLQSHQILSVLALPIFLKGKFEGFIGFDSREVEREWSDIEISLLNSFILLYVKALERNLLQKEVLQEKDNFFNFFNMIEDLLVVLDFDGKILDINNNVLERLKYSREELLGESYLVFHPEKDHAKVERNYADILEGREAYFNVPAITKEGHIFPIETTNTKGLWNGEPVIFSVVKDISELTLSEDKFSKAFNNSGVSMFISKFANGEILEVNDTFLKYLGYTEAEVIGQTTLELQMTQDYETRDLFKEQIKTNGKITDLEIQFITKNNIIRTGLTNIVPITINNEECLLSSIVDISDRIESEKRIIELSNRDELTNLYNRRFIYESVEEIIADYQENDEPFSVAILDIDDFKQINDRYGHQTGDCVLIEFSKVVKENLREYDVLGRYGGEEFVVLLNHADLQESNRVLSRVLDIVREHRFTCSNEKINLSFSAGITSCEELEKDRLSLDQLIGISDKRMYLAKQKGKNNIVYQE